MSDLFAQLLVEPGVVETAELHDGNVGRVGIMAFHGGSLEVGTDLIAEAVAQQSGASLYTVTQPPELTWHIPSKLFDPARSPKLAGFLDHVDTVVTVHGYGRPDRLTTLLLGGRNRELAAHLAGRLQPALPEYTIEHDLDAIPVELRGQHPDNPVNLPAAQGVQIELPPRVRGQGPFWSDHPPDTPIPHTEQLIEGLATAIGAWPV